MDIEKLLPGVKKNIFLKNFTTFRIGGPAKYFYIAKTKTELINAVAMAKKFNLPFFVLGGGSNVLVSDRGFKGLVMKIQNSKFKIQNENSKFKIICDAGILLSKLVSESLKIDAAGLEWAIGIPGTIGGAIYGNAGAFGKLIGDITKTVTVLEVKNQKPKVKIFKNSDCKFGYRDSIFKHNRNLIIVSAVLQFKKGSKTKIRKKIKEHLNYRQKNQPLNFPSAGSIFKNPRGFSAAELIEKSGLKGKKIGNIQISEKHTNFIVNLGKGKAKDVKKLIKLTKQKVKKKFGIVLEAEIQYFGF